MSNEIENKVEKRVVYLKELGNTFTASTLKADDLMRRLTMDGTEPTMENVILDITDVPIDANTFNKWLLELVSRTRLTVVDNSYDLVPQKANITYFDGERKKEVTEEMNHIPYPVQIENELEAHGITQEQFKEEFEKFNGIRFYWEWQEIEGERKLVKVKGQGEFYRRKVEPKKEYFKKRQFVIDQATKLRDGELDSIKLSDFIENNDNKDGYTAFDEASYRRVYNFIRDRIKEGNKERIIFNLGNIDTSIESQINVAKLFVLLNEHIELSDRSSGREFVLSGVCAKIMQLLFDFTSFQTFATDFVRKLKVGDELYQYRGTVYERLKIIDTQISDQSSVPNILFICEPVMTKFEREAYEGKSFAMPATLAEKLETKVTIDFQNVYNLRQIVLPVGIIEGTSQGLGDFKDRTRFLNKTEFKHFRPDQVIEGINPYVKGSTSFDSETDYFPIYKRALEEMYEEKGWGPVPELNLLDIVSGKPSPFIKTH